MAKPKCPKCDSDNIQVLDKYTDTEGNKVKQYQCVDCAEHFSSEVKAK